MKRKDGAPKKSKYSGLDRAALQNFKLCHGRVAIGKSPFIFWPRTREGYEAFLIEIGPKPNDGQKWSVGRIDHSKGYEPGNIRWELHRLNSVKRKGTKYEGITDAFVELDDKTPLFKKGSEEWIEHQKKASNKRWSDPKQKEAARLRMLGNTQGFKKKEN